MTLPSGLRLGPYEIVALLGAGGMGEVYKARDTRLDRIVAIKVVSGRLAEDAQFRDRFEREARTISQLNHPNICTLHDVGNQDASEYLVMEYVAGETLAARIERGPLPVEDALSIAQQIADALAAAHERGIIHRDVKPANAMFTSSNLVKLLDFGLADFEEPSAITRPGGAMGTLAYMAPEQLMQKGRTEPATDVWAIGLVLHEMLTGERAFHASTEVALFKSILTDPVPPIDRADVPKSVKRLIARALQKDPHDRHRSAVEFAEELKAAREQMSAHSASRTDRRRRQRVFAVAAALVLAAVAFAAKQFLDSRRVRLTREQTLPAIERLVQQDKYLDAYRLAVEAERYLGSDPSLASLWPSIAVPVSVATEPEGARVLYRPYGEQSAEWQELGTTPIKDRRLPRGPFRFRIEKEGFEPIARAQTLTAAFSTGTIALHPTGSLGGMVEVPGDRLAVSISGFNSETLASVDTFLIDRTEVTNREFKEFVDAGGYRRDELWFAGSADSRTYRDASGRAGPATWTNGTFAAGQEDFPVSGVSWFEANAYCEFRKKELPTVFHWARAALAAREITEPLGPSIVPLSNFSGKGEARVASYEGVGPYGTYDMAGNVREWVWNPASEGRRWILGGSWHEPDYMFSVPFSLPASDRGIENGFRCMQAENGPTPEPLQTRIEVTSPDYRNAKPVSDETFAVFAKQFAYVPSTAPAAVEARDKTPTGTLREKVTLDAGYGKERFSVYVFLPTNGKPPYQAVVYFPALNPFQSRSASDAFYPADYVVKSGRALVLPVYKGSFERWDETLGLTGEEYFRATRQRLLEWRQDLGRTLDYLGTRSDIDMTRVAYYGRSFGASMPLPLLALESRFKAAILHSAGFTYRRLPAEMDAVNYASRITIPVLMMTGRHDYVFPFETSQKPLFNLLGTPANQKRHVVYDAGHDPLPRSQVIREILLWLDKYLGVPG
ncbi:MAG TPA: protein kinase [Vicinamibacterales bacterium]|nr:protein kinase [Vicinamibacterales bacterium]